MYGTRMTKNVEHKVVWIDYFFHLMSPSKINYDMWPKNPPSYREVMEEYNKELLRLTDKVLGLMLEGQGFERKALKSSLGGQMIELEMKINMYPPCPQLELALGVKAHTDMSASPCSSPMMFPTFNSSAMIIGCCRLPENRHPHPCW